MKFYHLLLGLLLLIVTTSIFSAPTECIATATKDSGWANYDVSIDLMDYSTKKLISNLDLKAGNPKQNIAPVFTTSQTFDCEQHLMIYFKAEYTPVMWEANKGKTYHSSNIWDLTKQLQQLQIQSGATKLEIKINFPQDFVGVPTLIEGIH